MPVIDAVLEWRQRPGNILVREHADDSVRAVEKPHVRQVVGQHPDRLRVVADIEDDRRLARNDLETATQFGFNQAGTDCLHGHRQLVGNGFQRRQRNRRIEQLCRSAQAGIGQ